MSILQKLGYASFEEFEGSLLEESEEVKQGFVECGKMLFETRDSLRALVKEGISDGNREEALQLAKEADLIEVELKELKIRRRLNQKKWDFLALKKAEAEEKPLQLGWTMEQVEVADCANKEEEVMVIEDVVDMAMMEDELEVDQVDPGSCSLSTWMNEEEPHDDEVSIDTCVSFGHLGDEPCAGKGKASFPRQGSILPWMTTMEPCMKKQALSVVRELVGVACNLVMEGARARDKGGT